MKINPILFLILAAIIYVSVSVYAAKEIVYKEDYYQAKIAEITHGIREVKLDDDTRVDVVTDKEVIEVEFAHKWYEAIGQSAHYGFKTGKQPKIYLIKQSDEDDKYIKRCQNLCNNGIAIKRNNEWIRIQVEVYEENDTKKNK